MATDTRHVAPDPLPRRGADPRWLGLALGLGGAVLLFLGWWGVSGAATVAEQLPYFASGSIPGAALVVAGAVLLARESGQRAARRTDDLIAQLHALLVEEAPDDAPAPEPVARLDGLVAIAGSDHFHRAECLLVAGKTAVERVDADAIARRQLTPCTVCEPERPEA
jgi:hypothetical protein